MKKQEDPVTFKTRARILNQLGEQLIKSEDIALLELIKNAYDADAKTCHVIMENISDKDKARIIISDDGCGMDAEQIRRTWLELGTNYKESLAANEETKRTPKFHRMRLGEKGIGRFGVHRLGNKIDMYSKTEKSKLEAHLAIDWRKADEVEMIEQVPVSLTEGEPVYFKGEKKGTYIVISDLKGTWDRGKVREVARTIAALNSPFEDKTDFSVDLNLEGSDEERAWLKGVIRFKDIKGWSLYHFDVTMSRNRIISFKYDFKPWKTLDLLRPRHVEWKKNSDLSRMVEDPNGRNIKDIDITAIGNVRFRGVIFDLDPKILSIGVADKRGLKDYLMGNGGVRVYRDNMRVLNYGERGDDWLDLNFRRVNEPGSKISLNVICAAVSLSRESSDALVEKANREGFLKNEAFDRLRAAVLCALERVESERNIDKDTIRMAYGRKAEHMPLRASMADLRADVEKYVKDKAAQKKMRHCIDRVEQDYEEFANAFMKSAGIGMNLIMVIHQMEKIIKNVRTLLSKRNANTNLLTDQIETLSRLIEGYSILVRDSERKPRDLSGIITQSLFNVESRFMTHKIKIDEAFKNRSSCSAVCTEGHVINALLNLFDNSIWWLGYAKIKKPKIRVDLIEVPQYPNSLTLVVSDNGPGFLHEPITDLIRPFITFKPNGMGIGLHLTNEIMKSLGGKLAFPSPSDVDVPKEYANGATIALVFPKEV